MRLALESTTDDFSEATAGLRPLDGRHCATKISRVIAFALQRAEDRDDAHGEELAF